MKTATMIFDIPFTLAQVGWIAYVAVFLRNDKGDAVYSAIIACPII